MTNDNLQALSDAGVSIWLDDLSRDRLDSGNLAELVKVRNVVGVTTNPTIFQMALSKGTAYDDQLEKLAAAGKNVDETVFALTTDDVRNACDVMASVYDAPGGVDGRV
jgi:transaldolase